MVGDLNQARDGLVLANIEGTIMAIGGEYRGGPIQQIEAWDGERWLSVCVSIYPSFHLLIDISIRLSIHLSIYHVCIYTVGP